MTSDTSRASQRAPARDAALSLLALALRVLRGELTEEEAVAIVKRSTYSDDARSSDG